MKRGFKISNRALYTFITFGILIFLGISVYAYQTSGTATPSLMGHTANEIDFIGPQALSLKPGTADHVYIELFADSDASTTRSGYIGYPSAGSDDLNINNQMTGSTANIVLTASGDILLSQTGNVGIGTTSPSNRLDVNGAISITGSMSRSKGLSLSDEGTNKRIQSFESDPLYINPLGNNIVLNLNAGNVGIGTATPSYKLQVEGTINADSFVYDSDESLKMNVEVIENALEKLKQLEGVSFNWKDSGKASIGLIAQDVEKVIPEIVHTSEEGLKSVEYGNLVALLIEAVKEQQKQIDELKEMCS